MGWEPSKGPGAAAKGQGGGRDSARQRMVAIGALQEICGRVSGLWPMAVVEQVGSPLAGLAYLGQTEGLGTVMVELESLGEETGAFAEALRRVAPRSRLIGWSRTCQRELEEAAVRAGFDTLIQDGMDEGELAEKLGWERPRVQSQGVLGRNMSTVVEPAVKKEETAAKKKAESPGCADIEMEEAGTGTRSVAVPGVDAVLAEPVVLGGGAREEELGDVDLLAGMRLGREEFAKLLGRVIEQRTGLAVRLVVNGNEASTAESRTETEKSREEYLRVPIRQRERVLGMLEVEAWEREDSERDLPQQRLAGWAGWAGCWLAMHEHVHALRGMAFKDELTGVWNRRYFEGFLEAILKRAAEERFAVTLMVYDIDDFKKYNDQYGHAAGDEILRETARLMRSVIRTHDVVARIGGDEFAVVFWDPKGPRRPHSRHPADVRQAARRFQEAVCNHRFPKLLDQSRGTLTISGGLASFPWDGRTAQELLERADAMCLASKKQGKNVITFGPGALRTEEEE